jgi:hypothetical protein
LNLNFMSMLLKGGEYICYHMFFSWRRQPWERQSKEKKKESIRCRRRCRRRCSRWWATGRGR